ncbi:alpha-glucosidase (family GH31 glycosyl hydrolase) [Motilibacter peucedani]|uniref:Alpha-glucosidase (Family GH31 glycosyl hydrolase) n=1 Tax=Motilibacter peucedani TaxID=598650 RepID=A0A420XUK1_9ACTN|nr:glycoside hydrolase family 31 protein [Motilibacter peucedani]RKS80508.1 alpha-glucosidase (family GH31 glycosyl hydrolase) [Motilibacter peucedani]
MDRRFQLDTSPVAHPDAVLQGDTWRITVLAEGLVRLEWAADGRFEDRASVLALHRDLPVPEFTVTETPQVLEVTTERFRLVYDRGPFSPSGLSLQVRGNISSYHSVWRFGEPAGDLGGTARTLDMADGRLPLGPGVVSRWGVAELDDSASLLLDDDGWVAPRDGSRIDVYVFAYGRDHQAALDAFYSLSGRQPVLPRWALGNWWSRYKAYTADEYLALLDRFDEERLPFSVAVLDMDWHPVASVDPVHGSGWTGYSWNRELFPDPRAFLAEVHRRGYRVTLNVHPADGVRAFEDAYADLCRALGRNPDSGSPIAFDVTDPDFMTAYFDVLHRRLEDDGVDFWWVDWQSGPFSRVTGIDPLWVLNHFHFLDSARDGGRPLTFSRYAGPGSHRYPVGFSGDSLITWASLDFQAEFTATASNIGYGWWSHDIGGHLFGVRDDELALRWFQLGVFSPILRLHSSSNPFLVKEPWNFGAETAAAMGDALRLRHRLVPYLHSMNHRAATEGIPLVRPMYYLDGWAPEAYSVPNQFEFGSELVVAPITSPRDPVTLRGSVRAWLPPGTWADLLTGLVYDGGRELVLHRDDRSVPALVKAGGIVPLAAEDDLRADRNPERFEVVVVPGADGAFVLVEDDGTGSSTETIPTVRTPLVWDQSAGTLTIGPAEGATGAVPPTRTWTVTLLGADDQTGRRSVTVADAPVDAAVTVAFEPGLQPRTSAVRERLLDLVDRAQHPYEDKSAMWAVLESELPPAAQLGALQAQGVTGALLSAVTELLTARA